MLPASVETLGSEAYSLVRSHYGNHAKLNDELSSYKKLDTHNERVASAFGYYAEDLSVIPKNANLGVSCGNPIAIANLKLGETMIDLGSGAGLDVFIAARKVGPTGKAIGIDMTQPYWDIIHLVVPYAQEMLDLAAKNTVEGGYTNIEFIKSYIHSTPCISDGAADVITSNCVINLLPTFQKPEVFAEIYRLLKPGGRVSISDILGKKRFPEELRASVALYIGCISGASEVWEYETWLKDAGFEDITILDTVKDLNIYKEGIIRPEASNSIGTLNNCGKPLPNPTEATRCCGTASDNTAGRVEKDKIVDYDLNEWAGAFQIYAVKPTKSSFPIV